jgi:putative addiction module component (TIGR02574 family)
MATDVKTLTQKALKLSAEERLELVLELWDSIEDVEAEPLTQAQKDELDRRHELVVKDPDRAIPSEQSLANVRRELKRVRTQREAEVERA